LESLKLIDLFEISTQKKLFQEAKGIPTPKCLVIFVQILKQKYKLNFSKTKQIH